MKEDPVKDDDLEAAIAAYRSELDAGAALGAADLDEVEDHLRALIDELRAAGRSANVAFTEAVCRLGEPVAIAREYARVRPAFGAKLSRARAWSAAALITPFLALAVIELPGRQMAPLVSSLVGFELFLSVGVVVALVARLSWARPIALGHLVFVTATAAVWIWQEPGVVPPAFLPALLAIAAFLAPWRRRELTAAGWSLVLCAFSFAGVWYAFVNEVAAGQLEVVPVATVAYLLGAAGVLVRARWGSAALLVSAVAIGADVWAGPGDVPGWIGTYFIVSNATIAVALGAAAWLSSRTARPGVGTLRGLVA